MADKQTELKAMLDQGLITQADYDQQMAQLTSNHPDQADAEPEENKQAAKFAVKTTCPNCGSTDFAWQPSLQKFACNYCKAQFEIETPDYLAKAAALKNDEVYNLSGKTVSVGLSKAVDKENVGIVTYQCPNCGATISFSTQDAWSSIKCEWCRGEISAENVVPNGYNPDLVVRFEVAKERAQANVADFINRRRWLVSKKFLREFKAADIRPVYVPQMMIDVNANESIQGLGGVLLNMYTETYESDDGKSTYSVTYYDYDVYQWERHFVLGINDLTLGANEALSQQSKTSTNNVIDVVKPFDTSKAVPYQHQYLQGGYRSERRTLDVDDVTPDVQKIAIDMGYSQVQPTLNYDHGVRYDNATMEVNGIRYAAVLCPIWLYSYYEYDRKGNFKRQHYCVVNGQTGKTIGSMPINVTAQIGWSIAGAVAMFVLLFFVFPFGGVDIDIKWILGLSVAVFAAIAYFTYTAVRNTDKHNDYVRNTENEMFDLESSDVWVDRVIRSTNPSI